MDLVIIDSRGRKTTAVSDITEDDLGGWSKNDTIDYILTALQDHAKYLELTN